MAKQIQKIIVSVNPPEKMPNSFQAPRMRLTGLGWFLVLNGLLIVLYTPKMILGLILFSSSALWFSNGFLRILKYAVFERINGLFINSEYSKIHCYTLRGHKRHVLIEKDTGGIKACGSKCVKSERCKSSSDERSNVCSQR